MSEVEQLVKMANQIADNLGFHEDAAVRVADHLQRFWAPSMRQKLRERAIAGDERIKPLVKQAVECLESS